MEYQSYKIYTLDLPSSIEDNIMHQLFPEKYNRKVREIEKDKYSELLEISSILKNNSIDGKSFSTQFNWLCEFGFLNHVKYLIEWFGIHIIDPMFILFHSCKNNNIEVSEWLVNKYKITGKDIRIDDYNTFYIACKKCHIEAAQWLVDTFNLILEKDIKERVNEFLELICVENGNYFTTKTGEKKTIEFCSWLINTFDLKNLDISGLLQWVKDEIEITLDLISKTSMLNYACGGGNLSILKFIIGEYQFTREDIKSNQGMAFNAACEHGNLEVVKYLESEFNIISTFSKKIRRNIFCSTCYNGRLEVAKYLFDKFSIISRISFDMTLKADRKKYTTIHRLFERTCSYGHLEVAKWLVEVFKPDMEDDILMYHCGAVRAFPEASCKGYLDIVKYLDSLFKLEFKYFKWSGFHPFISICINGHFKVAKWVIERFNLSKEEIIKKNNRMLKLACEHGDLEFIKWLVGKYHITFNDIENEVPSIFSEACGKGYYDETRLKLVEFLIEKFNITDRNIIKKGLKSACRIGYIKIVEKLINTFNLSLEEVGRCEDCILLWANGRLRLIKSLIKLLNIPKKYIRKNKKELFKSFCERGKIKAVKWLIKEFNLSFNLKRSYPNIRMIGFYGCSRDYRDPKGFNLKTMQFLARNLGLTSDDIKNKDNKLLIAACKAGQIDILKWMVNTFGDQGLTMEDVREKDDIEISALDYAIKWNKNLQIARFLVEEFPPLVEDIKNNMKDYLNYAITEENAELIWWLYEISKR